MIKHRLAVSALVLSLFSITLFSSCKKINEATELGGSLIPAVDNVTTFDTTLTVEAYNNLFADTEDSTRSTSSDQQFVGITNDPIFGKTEASLFLQLRPSIYPYSFPFKKDSLIALDSVVLVLGVNAVYGDTNTAQQVKVFEISNADNFRADSNYMLRKNNFTLGQSISSLTSFIPNTLNDSIFPKREQAERQLRIKLDNSFGQRLLAYDSTRQYNNDSAFATYFKGFAVVPQGSTGNSLVGINLADTNTKLAFYYRYKNGGVVDTVTYFKTTGSSASANYIKRDYSGSQLATYQGGTTPDNLVFIQNTPGTYATLKIPGLNTISNRVVHRAELIMEQVYSPSTALSTPPQFLYLDAFDSANNRFRSIPFDLLTTPGAQSPIFTITNTADFGMIGKLTTDASGNKIYSWHFNITRYVQHVLNKTQPLQNLRLYSPFIIHNYIDDYKLNGLLFANSSYAIGQVRLGGGNNATQPMRLRIIYSKL